MMMMMMMMMIIIIIIIIIKVYLQFDELVSFHAHVSSICGSSFYHLRNLNLELESILSHLC